MAAKSCISGAPSTAAQALRAAMPGMISMLAVASMAWANSKTSPAMA